MDLHLKGKAGIVTGGGAGIGSGICEALAAEGVNLVVTDFRPVEQTQAFCDELSKKYGVKAIAVWGDVSKEESVKQTYQVALDNFGTVDILCNNAARMGPTPVMELNTDIIRSFEAVTLEGMFMMCQEFIRIHREQKKKMGHIVITVSKSGFTSHSVNNICYVATKGAQASFVRGLATEVGREGIWVNGIIPGYVYTERTARPEGRERQKYMDQFITVGREAQPREIGDTVAFLCSDRSCQIMGHCFDATGGTLL